jgi:hypothetical protein
MPQETGTTVYLWIAGEFQIVAIAVKVECLAALHGNGGIPAESRPAGYQVNRPDSALKRNCAPR